MAKIIKGKKFDILSNVRDFYAHVFPYDTFAIENLNPNISFAQILARMECGEDIYKIINVNDSIVRERLMDYIALFAGIKYPKLYDMWLNADELAAKNLNNN